jgi:cyclopropane fatty-acyl-phospholipid synthase-like methyltransferase
MEWFADYPKHYHLKPDDTGAEEAAFICKILHLRKGQSVLDAPCGAGRVSVCLARAGMNVSGVDLTPSYIQRARKRFRSEGFTGKFIVADLRDIDFAERFDGAFNWQGSFGFFSEEDNLDVVRRYARSLRSGGRLLIDMPSREWLLRHFRAKGHNGDIEFAARWKPEVERTDTHFRNVKTGESWSMTIRHYTPAQYGHLFRQAGLKVEAFYCDLHARPFHRGARRVYVVGRKP